MRDGLELGLTLENILLCTKLWEIYFNLMQLMIDIVYASIIYTLIVGIL
jgi:hypothetical protein